MRTIERMKNMTIFKVKTGQIAGFEVIGYRQKDGTIKLGNQNGEQLADFPEAIETPYGIFTLELIKKNDKDNSLPPGHEGKDIEWGIYV